MALNSIIIQFSKNSNHLYSSNVLLSDERKRYITYRLHTYEMRADGIVLLVLCGYRARERLGLICLLACSSSWRAERKDLTLSETRPNTIDNAFDLTWRKLVHKRQEWWVFILLPEIQSHSTFDNLLHHFRILQIINIIYEEFEWV